MNRDQNRAQRDAIPLVSLSDIEAAAQRLEGRIIKTPLVTSRIIDEQISKLVSPPGGPAIDIKICFKAEHLQVTGAFKARGAGNAIQLILARLRKENPDFDSSNLCVLTHSSGNHAAGIALQAKLAGVQAAVVMPETAPQIKKDNTASHGARIWFCKPTQQAREEMAKEAQRQLESEGLVIEFIHAYDHPAIIAGQGTLGREMMLQAPYLEDEGGVPQTQEIDGFSGAGQHVWLGGPKGWNKRSKGSPPLDLVIAPTGGGGMLSGVSTAVKGIDPRTVVIGAEPKAVDDAARSFETGIRQPPVTPAQTICDGLMTSLSDLTLAHIERRVDTIATASERSVLLALKAITSATKQLIEPSAAVTLAVLLEDNSPLHDLIREIHSRKVDQEDKSVRIGMVWSGGNTTVQSLAEYLSKV